MARLLTLQKIVDDGMHNAVTDLVRWSPPSAQNSTSPSYWLAYRAGHRHMTFPPGDVVILHSEDAEHWEPAARLSTGWDDRDPKLVPDGDRMLVYFGSHEETRTADGDLVPDTTRHLYTYVSATRDGHLWDFPERVFGPSWWLWAPKRFADGFWSTAYGSNIDREGSPMEVILAHSEDGYRWRRHATLLSNRLGTEGTLHRLAPDRMLAVIRGTGDETHFMRSNAPFTEWDHHTVPHWIHAPAVAEVGDQLIVAGRDHGENDSYTTSLWSLKDNQTEHLLDLPSGGDTSYCGLVAEPDGTLLVSYYSQHEFLDRPDFQICEKPSAIYLARVEL